MTERRHENSNTSKSTDKLVRLLARFYGGDQGASSRAVNDFLNEHPDAEFAHIFNALSSGLGSVKYRGSGKLNEGELFPNRRKRTRRKR